jgi:hypothetical protein
MRRLVAALFVAVSVTPLFVSPVTCQSSPEAKIVVPARDGTLEVTNLTIEPEGKVTGLVRNNTQHDWSTVMFTVSVFDQEGKQLRPRMADLAVFGLGVGETKPMDGRILGINAKKVARVALQVADTSTTKPRFTLRIVKPQSRPDLTMEDERVELRLVVVEQGLQIVLRNKGNVPILLDWNSASFVDFEGKAFRVIHSGVKLVDRDSPQVPSVIPPGASIEDMVVSFDRIRNDPPVGLHVRPFLGYGDAAAMALKGRTFGLLLPLVVEGKTDNLMVTVLVENVIL